MRQSLLSIMRSTSNLGRTYGRSIFSSDQTDEWDSFLQSLEKYVIDWSTSLVSFLFFLPSTEPQLFSFLAISCLDHGLEAVKNEIQRLDSSMEKAGEWWRGLHQRRNKSLIFSSRSSWSDQSLVQRNQNLCRKSTTTSSPLIKNNERVEIEGSQWSIECHIE